MNCAELVYVVFKLATKLSSRMPMPKRLIVTDSVTDSTNSIRSVRNFRRMSARLFLGRLNHEIRVRIAIVADDVLWTYRKTASNAAHCTPSGSTGPNTSDT